MDHNFLYSHHYSATSSRDYPLAGHTDGQDPAIEDQGDETPKKRPKYTRSRTGCMTCRTKKIKCDEEKPQCSRCKNAKRECVWPDATLLGHIRPRRVVTRKKPATKKSGSSTASRSISEESSPSTTETGTPPSGTSPVEFGIAAPFARRYSAPYILSHSDTGCELTTDPDTGLPSFPDKQLSKRDSISSSHSNSSSGSLSLIPEINTYSPPRYEVYNASGYYTEMTSHHRHTLPDTTGFSGHGSASSWVVPSPSPSTSTFPDQYIAHSQHHQQVLPHAHSQYYHPSSRMEDANYHRFH